MKEKEFRRIGIPKILPTARHGDFDPRILASDLKRQLLPETVRMDSSVGREKKRGR